MNGGENFDKKNKRRGRENTPALLHHLDFIVEMSESTRRGHLMGIFPILPSEERRGFRKKEDGEEFGGCRVSAAAGPKRVPSRV